MHQGVVISVPRERDLDPGIHSQCRCIIAASNLLAVSVNDAQHGIDRRTQSPRFHLEHQALTLFGMHAVIVAVGAAQRSIHDHRRFDALRRLDRVVGMLGRFRLRLPFRHFGKCAHGKQQDVRDTVLRLHTNGIGTDGGVSLKFDKKWQLASGRHVFLRWGKRREGRWQS